MPSLNQISNGLVTEALVQLRLAMGDVKNQKVAIDAQRNIQKTWEELLAKVHVDDRDHLDRLFEAIREVPDVVRVVRGSMRLLKRKGTHAFWAMALPDSEDDSPPSAPPLGI